MSTRVIRNLGISVMLAAAGASFGQTPQTGTTQTTTSQSRVVGVVTAADKTTGQVTVKTDAGETVVIVTNSGASTLRMPAGEMSADKAVKITVAEISVGERVFARGIRSADGKTIDAGQLVVTSAPISGTTTQGPQRQREDFRQRGLVGRITAVNTDKKEVSLQSRSREGTGPITVSVSDSTRVFRYAPDSLDIKNASRSSFTELRVGDQLRALGQRSDDGTRFTAEEIIAGSIARTGGQVVAVDPGKNELTIKNAQGQNVVVAIGARSSLRRVTPEVAATLEATRPARPAAGGQSGQERRPRERRERPAGAGEGDRRPRGGRGFQDLLESLPAITINDLKKGDTVFVSGSESTDPPRLTAIMLVTGDAAFMSRFLQAGPNRGPQSPGLPGDVLGGGVGSAERPTSP